MVQPQCVAICNPSILDCAGWRSAWPKKQLPVRCNRCGSPRGNVGFLLALVGPPHNLSHPPANGCTREFFHSQFSEVDSKNYLGSQPWPANTSNRKFPWKSTFNPMAIRVCPACFARKVEGLELDIAVCIARLGRNTRTGERFESWKLFFFGDC